MYLTYNCDQSVQTYVSLYFMNAIKPYNIFRLVENLNYIRINDNCKIKFKQMLRFDF